MYRNENAPAIRFVAAHPNGRFADELATGGQEGFELGAFGQRDALIYPVYFVGDLAGQCGGLLPHKDGNNIAYLRVILRG